MAARIEDYALIGDCHTAALVSRAGSVDWLCMPRFDSAACFAALLGTPEHGRWSLAPASAPTRTTRAYRRDTLVLETEHTTGEGVVSVIDCMPPRTDAPVLVRVVEGRAGRVTMRSEFAPRFDCGSWRPLISQHDGTLRAAAGPDALVLRAHGRPGGQGSAAVGEFTIAAGERVEFHLTWYPSYCEEPQPRAPGEVVGETERFWRAWGERCAYQGPWRDAVVRSLVTVKALTYAPTGGIVAAPTTSLPEDPGGVRNWDYRYCWLRDATFTLLALTGAGYLDEAGAWREWLLRAAAAEPSKLQIMYGITGKRRLEERELPWLPGYEGSKPVRAGNAAHGQYQLDVYGELLDAMFHARRAGLSPRREVWEFERALLDHLDSNWTAPDNGIWEIRGERRQFTHSKVMAWAGVDRAIKSAERFGMEAPLEEWRALRARIHADVCARGYDANVGSFVQTFGSRDLDASLLMIPLVGFLPADDARVRGTIAAVERGLMRHGFVARYDTRSGIDGLPGSDRTFLPCSFWLAHAYGMAGRRDEARALFERLLSVRNDVGLLAEEYDPDARRLVGNFPQAFSHVALLNTAYSLAGGPGRAEPRIADE